MALYLGLDFSTQSASAVVVDVDPPENGRARRREVVCVVSLQFDDALPSYGTRSGVLPSEDPRVAHSVPLMWVEALDLLLARLRDEGVDLSAVRAIAGSGQQHGSVYLGASAPDTLASLDGELPLVEQVRDVFTRSTSPIWMDSSTADECEEITDSLGGPEAVAELTGSRAFERFTGPQIRRFYKLDPEAFALTRTVHLVSSFMASLIAGGHAPIDPGDAAGTNLIDIRKKAWSHLAVAATAPGLKPKLPPIAPSSTVVGRVSPYFVARHGMAPDARAIVWSGDNPCSLIGVGLVRAGRIAISLGTSDTLFGFMPELGIDPAGEGHVFGSPTGEYMSLICFKNGSLARERVRDRFGLDWDGFDEALRATPPGNDGKVMLPWFEPEITPNVLEAGERLYGVDADDGPGLVRAVVEGQMASMVLHSRWMGVTTREIYATGGASRNREILQVMANVHGAEVFPFRVGNSAALGAALRAWHADRVADGEEVSWDDIIAGFAEPVREERVSPDPDAHATYRRFVELYAECESAALRGEGDPAAARERFVRG